ncbi:hypothetical protein [Streptomyces kanasensis]|uniref:Uncharacterized protein n=1 Tax=Streptomyces kanasensis TaxID=936756 RepID=A0A124ECP7_9ACTN|nr:hypothetical protein [Streptomyces kanasensis]KUH38273.1 hypothetical protein ATE80_13915 [Streptomyces kanasensis]
MPENTVTAPLAPMEPQDVADAFAYIRAIHAADIDTACAVADDTGPELHRLLLNVAARCGTPTPGCGDEVGHSTRWAPPSGLHRVEPTPVRRMTMDSTVVRTAMVRHRTRCAAPPDDARHSLARAGAPHPMLRTAPVRPPSADPLSGCGRTRATPLSSSATATFPLDIAGFGLRSGRGQGDV